MGNIFQKKVLETDYNRNIHLQGPPNRRRNIFFQPRTRSGPDKGPVYNNVPRMYSNNPQINNQRRYFNKRSNRPSNDLYPYMFENEEDNLPSLSNLHRRDIRHPVPRRLRTKLQKLNRLRRSALPEYYPSQQKEVRAAVIPRSENGLMPVSGDRYPERKTRDIKRKLPNSLDEIDLRDYNRDIQNGESDKENTVQTRATEEEDEEGDENEEEEENDIEEENENRNPKIIHIKMEAGKGDEEAAEDVLVKYPQPDEGSEDIYEVDSTTNTIEKEVTKNIGLLNIDTLIRQSLEGKPAKKREMQVKILENGKVVQEYEHKDNDGSLIVNFKHNPTEPPPTTSSDDLQIEPQEKPFSLDDNQSDYGKKIPEPKTPPPDMNEPGNDDTSFPMNSTFRQQIFGRHRQNMEPHSPFSKTNSPYSKQKGFEKIFGMEVNDGSSSTMSILNNEEAVTIMQDEDGSDEREFQKRNHEDQNEDDKINDIWRRKLLLRKLARLEPYNRSDKEESLKNSVSPTEQQTEEDEEDDKLDSNEQKLLNIDFNDDSPEARKARIEEIESYLRENPPYFALEDAEVAEDSNVETSSVRFASEPTEPTTSSSLRSQNDSTYSRFQNDSTYSRLQNDSTYHKLQNDSTYDSFQNGSAYNSFQNDSDRMNDDNTTEDPVDRIKYVGLSVTPWGVQVFGGRPKNKLHQNNLAGYDPVLREGSEFFPSNSKLKTARKIYGNSFNKNQNVFPNNNGHSSRQNFERKRKNALNSLQLNDSIMELQLTTKPAYMVWSFPVNEIVSKQMEQDRWKQLQKSLDILKPAPGMTYDANKYPINSYIRNSIKHSRYENFLKKLHNLGNSYDNRNPFGIKTKHSRDVESTAGRSHDQFIPKRNILLNEEDFEEVTRTDMSTTPRDIGDLLLDMVRSRRRLDKSKITSKNKLVKDSDDSFSSYVPSRQIKSLSESPSLKASPEENSHVRKKRSYPLFSNNDNGFEYYFEEPSLTGGQITRKERKEVEYSDEQDTETGSKNKYTVEKKTSNTLANPSTSNDPAFEEQDMFEPSGPVSDDDTSSSCKNCNKQKSNKASVGTLTDDEGETSETEGGDLVETTTITSHHKHKKHKKHREYHYRHHHKHHKFPQYSTDATKTDEEVLLRKEDLDSNQKVIDDILVLRASLVDRDVQRLISDDEKRDIFDVKKRSSGNSKLILRPASYGNPKYYYEVPEHHVLIEENDDQYFLPTFNSRRLKSIDQSDNSTRLTRHFSATEKKQKDRKISEDEYTDDNEKDNAETSVTPKVVAKTSEQDYDEEDAEVSKRVSTSAPTKKKKKKKHHKSNEKGEDDEYEDSNDDEKVSVSRSKNGNDREKTHSSFANHRHKSKKKTQEEKKHHKQKVEEKKRNLGGSEDKKRYKDSVSDKEKYKDSDDYEELADDSLSSMSSPRTEVKYIISKNSDENKFADETSKINRRYIKPLNREVRMQNFQELYKKHPWIKMDNLDQASFNIPFKTLDKRSQPNYNIPSKTVEKRSLPSYNIPSRTLEKRSPPNYNIASKASEKRSPLIYKSTKVRRQDIPPAPNATNECNQQTVKPTDILPKENPKEENAIVKPTTCSPLNGSFSNEGAVCGLEDVENGHIAAGIVTSVLKEVALSPSLQKFASALDRKNSKSVKKMSFDMLTCGTGADMTESKQLLNSIRNVLNKLVLAQIQRRICQHLPKELSSYLARITSCGRKGNEVEQIQKQRGSNTMDSSQTNYLFNSQEEQYNTDHTPGTKTLETKIHVCENLLDKYHSMDQESQARAEPVKNYIQSHMESAKKVLNCQTSNVCEGPMTVDNAAYINTDESGGAERVQPMSVNEGEPGGQEHQQQQQPEEVEESHGNIQSIDDEANSDMNIEGSESEENQPFANADEGVPNDLPPEQGTEMNQESQAEPGAEMENQPPPEEGYNPPEGQPEGEAEGQPPEELNQGGENDGSPGELQPEGQAEPQAEAQPEGQNGPQEAAESQPANQPQAQPAAVELQTNPPEHFSEAAVTSKESAVSAAGQDKESWDKVGIEEGPDFEQVVEKELESVGLGTKKKDWHPDFSLEKMIKQNLDKINPQAAPKKRQSPSLLNSNKHKREATQSDKYKKLVNAVQEMKRKRKGEELIAQLYGETQKDEDYPSIRSRNVDAQNMNQIHFDEPLVYSMT